MFETSTHPGRRHWCDLCHGHTGPDSPCYSGPEPDPEPEEPDEESEDEDASPLRGVIERLRDRARIMAPKPGDNPE